MKLVSVLLEAMWKEGAQTFVILVTMGKAVSQERSGV